MQTGNENWKWGAVFILMATFLITANQAYQNVTRQEAYEPPDDYLKGDSWDIENQGGPGAGQAIELPAEIPTEEPVTQVASEAIIPEGDDEPLLRKDEIDWNEVKDPSEAKTDAPIVP